MKNEHKTSELDYHILMQEFGPKGTFRYTLDEWLQAPLYVVRSFNSNNRICGIGVFSINKEEKSCYVFWVYVIENNRSNGIAEIIYNLIQEVCLEHGVIEIVCNVRWTNCNSIFSLKKNGYRITGFMNYNDGEPGYNMKKQLTAV